MANLDKIGLGTYRLKGEKCYHAVLNALKIGYRTIDTAELYSNHDQIARAIKDSGIERDKIFLISKIHNNDQVSFRVKEGFDKILKELETDYLDLILLHAPTPQYTHSWKILQELKGKNYVRYIGVSNFRIGELKNLDTTPYLNQIEVNPFNIRKELTTYCKENNIIVQSYAPLTKAKKIDIINPSLMLNWSLSNGYYTIPCSSNIDHLKENFNTPNIKRLSCDDILFLNSFDEKLYTIPHYKD